MISLKFTAAAGSVSLLTSVKDLGLSVKTFKKHKRKSQHWLVNTRFSIPSPAPPPPSPGAEGCRLDAIAINDACLQAELLLSLPQTEQETRGVDVKSLYPPMGRHHKHLSMQKMEETLLTGGQTMAFLPAFSPRFKTGKNQLRLVWGALPGLSFGASCPSSFRGHVLEKKTPTGFHN